jgi:hypothetical protein
MEFGVGKYKTGYHETGDEQYAGIPVMELA